MLDLTSNYAGIALRNPIVVGSSGLTNSAQKIEKLVAAGAGAVVLKSLFEEQIDALSKSMTSESDYPEAADYISGYVKANEINKYLDFVRDVKKRVNVPVIASINCYKAGDWTTYAKQIAETGVDALEVNIMRLEGKVSADATHLVNDYVAIVKGITGAVKIPVQVKLAKTFSCLPAMVDKLRLVGAAGVTLFDRSYQMDIDIENERISGGEVFTTAVDLSDTLRYTGLIAGQIANFPVSASTGIHTSEGVIKALLAGASSVQMCSALYKHGAQYIQEVLAGLTAWMERKQYNAVHEFRGKLKAEQGADATQYTRMQFMKYFTSHE